MALVVTHAKTNNVPDWTQHELDTVISGGAAPTPPVGTTLSEITLPSDWNSDHVLTGFDEAAQDAVGGILTDTATIDFTYSDATPSIAADVKDASLGSSKLTSELSEKINTTSDFASGTGGGLVTGQYYDSALHLSTSSTLAGVANRMELMPFFASSDMSIDRIGVSVSTGVASATCKLVIYNAGTDGWPSTVAWEGSSNLDCSVAAFVEETLSFTFTGGKRYWLAVRHSSTATLRTVPVSGMLSLGLQTSNGTTYFGFIRRTVTYANAAPSPWVFSASELVANTGCISIRMRKA